MGFRAKSRRLEVRPARTLQARGARYATRVRPRRPIESLLMELDTRTMVIVPCMHNPVAGTEDGENPEDNAGVIHVRPSDRKLNWQKKEDRGNQGEHDHDGIHGPAKPAWQTEASIGRQVFR